MPFFHIKNIEEVSAIVGIEKVWFFSPESVSIGEDVDIKTDLASNLTVLMLKGVTFFFISI